MGFCQVFNPYGSIKYGHIGAFLSDDEWKRRAGTFGQADTVFSKTTATITGCPCGKGRHFNHFSK
jgi:hypothetical protein